MIRGGDQAYVKVFKHKLEIANQKMLEVPKFGAEVLTQTVEVPTPKGGYKIKVSST